MKKTIVIIDDHILIAKALGSIIADFEHFEVLYESCNGQDFIEKLTLTNPIPDIVLLDISMPVMNGFETACWIKENYPSMLIMALSMQDDEESVIKMIKNGATSYMLKNASPNDLEKALNHMVKDGFYYQEWASRMVFASLKNERLENTLSLNHREKEFLSYCITEMSYKEIADKMSCSPRTIEGYRDQLCEKLDLKTRVGLAVYALKNGYDLV